MRSDGAQGPYSRKSCDIWLSEADKFISTGGRPINVAVTEKIRLPPAKGHRKQKKLHQSKKNNVILFRDWV